MLDIKQKIITVARYEQVAWKGRVVPVLGDCQTHLDMALSTLLQMRCEPSFEQEVGLGYPEIPSNINLCDSTPACIFLFSPKPAVFYSLTMCRWSLYFRFVNFLELGYKERTPCETTFKLYGLNHQQKASRLAADELLLLAVQIPSVQEPSKCVKRW